MQWFAVGGTSMLGREQYRPCLFVARPACGDEAWLLGSAVVKQQCLDAIVLSDVEVPSIAGRVTAGFRGVFYRHQRGRTCTDGQFLSSLIGDGGAGVPISMEGKQNPVVVVYERGFNLVLHLVGLAA